MGTLKVTSWNIEHLDRLMGDDLDRNKEKRLENIVREINDISPDILCVIEGPRGEEAIRKFADTSLGGRYAAVTGSDGTYDIKGDQWIWFLVRDALKDRVSLLPTETWNDFSGGRTWKVNYWGDYTVSNHSHYRQPQVLVLDWDGQRVEFIGLHLKSKFVIGGKSAWEAGGKKREEFISKAIKARIKMATEAANVRSYIDAKFAQVEKPAIFVMGDLNDGPGKEYFEKRFLFFDLLSNIQGDIFSANKFLNHALFDYPSDLRWTVKFKDFITPGRKQEILLDHILFTQGLVDGSLPLQVRPHAGYVEHEVHDLVNANVPSKQETSDHRPMSLDVATQD